MPTISRRSIHQVLDRAAKTITAAAGGDGRASRADVSKKLKELTGSERALVDTFYRFMDHRDAAPGASVTTKDVASALRTAKSKLVDAYDTNRDGLAPDEVAKMSTLGKLAAELAQSARTPRQAARDAAAVLVTPKWSPNALPAVLPSALSPSAKRSFDAMTKAAAQNDLLSPPIARKLTAGGEPFTVVAQFMHDSFSIELYGASGRRVAHGSGWGTAEAPLEWR